KISITVKFAETGAKEAAAIIGIQMCPYTGDGPDSNCDSTGWYAIHRYSWLPVEGLFVRSTVPCTCSLSETTAGTASAVFSAAEIIISAAKKVVGRRK